MAAYVPSLRLGAAPLRCHVLIVALVFSICAFAKDKDKEKSSDVKFTSRTELVLIPTLVTDKSGVHVSGLKKEDFVVLENGSQRQVATFEEVTSDRHRLERRSDPNEFSNSLGSGPSTRRVTLIVLDFINTPFLDQTFARKEMLKYLSQSVDRREPTGLYTLTRSGIHVVHDFTTSPSVLMAALRKVNGDTSQLVDTPEDMEELTGTASPQGGGGDTSGADGASGGKGGSSAALAAQVEQAATRLQNMVEDQALNFQSFQQRLAITYTLEGMQQLAQMLAGVPGRKSLIWAGGGFPFSVSDTTMQLAPAGRDSLSDVLPLYERTWQLLNDAEIALYPVDVKGLQNNFPSAAIGTPESSRHPGAYMRSASWRQMDTQATLQTFADATGGRAYFNSNDLVKGFREAVHDSKEYYMLGYYLDRSNTKPGWRKIAVKVNRDHVEVRARRGFFVTDATVNPETSRDSDIAMALRSPLDYTGLSLVAHWDAVEASKEAGKKSVHYVVKVAPDSDLVNAADGNHIFVDFMAVAITAMGTQVDRPAGKRIDLRPAPELLAAIRQQGASFHGTVDLAAGEYTVRFVVRDNLTGRVGSVAAPLKVE